MASPASQVHTPDTANLIPVAPVRAAILAPGVLRFSHWHMAQALSQLPDPCPWPVLATAITNVLKPLRWRTEGLQQIEAALDRLHRQGVIRIPGYVPEPCAPEPAPGPRDFCPRCAYCGQPCRTTRSKYCSASHKQLAYRARRMAEGLTPGAAARQSKRASGSRKASSQA